MPELALNSYHTSDNWVPEISRIGGMGMLIALTAPRPLLNMNVDADFSTSSACETMVNAARPYYRLFNAEENVLHTIEKGRHNFTQRMREVTYGFADRWLKGNGDGFPIPETDFSEEIFDEEDPGLLVFEGGKIPSENAETVLSIWTTQAKTLRTALPHQLEQFQAKLQKALQMPPVPEPYAIKNDCGFLLTTDPGVQIAVFKIGTGPHAVLWLGGSDFNNKQQRPDVKKIAETATVFVIEPKGAGMADDMYILRHTPIVMGRPLCGMWAYDLLCTVNFLLSTQKYETISAAARSAEMGLACLIAAIFDPRLHSIAIEEMFTSFVQLVGYSNPAPQIPGILKSADIPHFIRAAGNNRVHIKNAYKDKEALLDGIHFLSKTTEDFFDDWVKGI